MSLDQNDKTSLLSKLAAYLGITLSFQVVGFITTLVYTSYFNQTRTFTESFLFRSSDSPPTPPGFTRPSPFGNHLFGDYLWIYAEIKQNGLGGYMGASQIFLLIASKLPYYLSLLSLFVVSGLLIFSATKSLLSGFKFPEQLALLTGGFLSTQPLLLALDRGQIHLLLFALLLLGLTLSLKEGANRTWGAVLIAAAISMKLAPVFFLLIFVKKGYWKELKVSLFSLTVFLLIPVAYLHTGIGAWKYQLGLSETNKDMAMIYNSQKYFTESLAFNNSFKLLSYHFSQMESGIGNIAVFIYENYFWFAGFIGVFLCWLITQKNVTKFESVLLMAIASSFLIPIAVGYTLLVFILPIVVVLTDKDFIFSRLNLIYCCYIGIVLMPKQIALGFSTFKNESITLGGILNPGLSLIVIVFIACKCLYLGRRHSTTDGRARINKTKEDAAR
jgi:hypothetical protein